MTAAINDRRSLYVLLSLLVFFVLNPFLQNNRLGEFFLVVLMYLTLIPSLLELHGKRTFRWLAISLAVPYMLAVLTGIFYPVHRLVIVDYALLMAFFGFSSVALFAYLGQPGAITSGRVYAPLSDAGYVLVCPLQCDRGDSSRIVCADGCSPSCHSSSPCLSLFQRDYSDNHRLWRHPSNLSSRKNVCSP
jgi:hypothetical protein